MFNDIVIFLTPFFSREAEREALLIHAFHDHDALLSKINYTGSAAEFVPRLVHVLQQHGEIATDIQALWHLLFILKQQVGADRQQQIEAYQPWANNSHAITLQNKGGSNQPRKYHLHQRYLRHLVERIGTLNLAMFPENAQEAYIEEVFIDTPTAFSLSVEVENWKIVKWWLIRRDEWLQNVLETELGVYQHYGPNDLGYEAASLEALVQIIQQTIDAYHSQTPDKKPHDRGNKWRNGVYEDVYPLHICHIVALWRKLVILGAPGSGKSAAVKYIALCLAGEQIEGWTRLARLNQLDESWKHGLLTPIYVELSQFVASPDYPSDRTPTADDLWHYIERELQSNDLGDYAPGLKIELEKYEENRTILILDGLDEVSYLEGGLGDRQKQLMSLIKSLTTCYRSRILITSRPYTYRDTLRLKEFHTATITALDKRQRISLITRLLNQTDLKSNIQIKAEALNKQLDIQNVDEELKNRPLYVTLMTAIYLQNGSQNLPTQRGALYRESILLLLDHWIQTNQKRESTLHDVRSQHAISKYENHMLLFTLFHNPGVGKLAKFFKEKAVNDLYECLEALAYDVHTSSGEETDTEIIQERLSKHLNPLGEAGRHLIKSLINRASVLECHGQDTEQYVFRFAHRTFQEYLAASYITRVCMKNDQFKLVIDLIEARPQLWREPCQMVGDVLRSSVSEHLSDLWQLIGDLLDDGPPVFSSNMTAWWRGWLAIQIAIQQDLHQQTSLRKLTEQTIRRALIDWALKLIETPQVLVNQVISYQERADFGRAIGLFGDPRPGVGLKIENKLPDLNWCEIPAGHFIYGGDETLSYEVDLPAFSMARYPITYQQFEVFTSDHANGFSNSTYWQKLAANQDHRTKCGEQRWKIGNYPREYVSWYDAMAFCYWLTDRYRADGLITDREEIRLPTEFEWEKAARGTEGFIYPYGKKHEPTKGNTAESRIFKTTAVGLFPDGASPYGVLDVSGNVWEWCLSTYQNPNLNPNEEDISSDVARVLRGGSTACFKGQVSCTTRFYHSPHYRGYDTGFRVVRALITV